MKSLLIVPLVASTAFAFEAADPKELMQTLGFSFPRGNQGQRHLRSASVPSVDMPENCEYKPTHEWESFILKDEIVCKDWCGAGADFTLTATTYLDENFNVLESFADCKVPSCQECGDEVGGCACPEVSTLKDMCEAICEAGDFSAASLESDPPSDYPSTSFSSVPSDVPSDQPSDQATQIIDEGVLAIPSQAPSLALGLANPHPTAPSPSAFTSIFDAASLASDLPSDSPSDQPSSSAFSEYPSDIPTIAPGLGISNPSDEFQAQNGAVPEIFPAEPESSPPSSIPSDTPSDSPSFSSDWPSDLPTTAPSLKFQAQNGAVPEIFPAEPESAPPSDVPSLASSDLPSSMPSDVPTVLN